MSKYLNARLERVHVINTGVDKAWTDKWWSFVLTHANKVSWGCISVNENLTMDIVRNNPDMPWNLYGIHNNPNINKNITRVTYYVYRNIGATCELNEIDISEDNTTYWRDGVSRNPNITINFIKNNINKPFNWHNISNNIAIKLDDILANPDLPWVWDEITYNPNITCEHIKAYPDLPWVYHNMVCNPNLTMDFVTEYSGRTWPWHNLSCNTFSAEKTEFTAFTYKKHLAVYRIQQWWTRLRLDPRHPVGERRLEREYDELFGLEAL